MAEQLPKVEFELEESKLLKLRFSEPRSGEGEYGTWWLYGADEWDEDKRVWKQVSWFTNERIVAILKDWKAKKGDEFLVFKKAGESKETGKVFTYFVITNKKTKETKSTKDMNATPVEESLSESPPEESPESKLPVLESLSTSSQLLEGLITQIEDVFKKHNTEIPPDFALTLLNCDGFWRTWNTLIMGQAKLNGR